MWRLDGEIEAGWQLLRTVAMSSCLSRACSFLFLCTSSFIIMPVKYMREIMENFQAFCNQTSLHGWQYITQRPETDGFWAGNDYNVDTWRYPWKSPFTVRTVACHQSFASSNCHLDLTRTKIQLVWLKFCWKYEVLYPIYTLTFIILKTCF